MKNPKISYILVYISEIVIGILMLLFTNQVFNYMSFLIGSIVILFGLIKSVISIKSQQTEQKTLGNQASLVIGILMVFAGIFILIMHKNVIAIMPIIFSAYIILGAIFDIIEGIKLKKLGFIKWWIFLIISLSLILGSVLTILNLWKSDSINSKVIGVLLIIKGITDIVTLFLSYIGGNKKEHEQISQSQTPQIEADFVDSPTSNEQITNTQYQQVENAKSDNSQTSISENVDNNTTNQ